MEKIYKQEPLPSIGTLYRRPLLFAVINSANLLISAPTKPWKAIMNPNADNTATSNTTDGSSVSSAFEHNNDTSEGFLKIDAGGIVGFFERMPLWLKLLFITLLASSIILSLAGWLIGVESYKVNDMKNVRHYTTNFLVAAGFAEIVQREGERAILHLALPSEQNMENYGITFAEIDRQCAKLTAMEWFEKDSEVNRYVQQINMVRESVVTQRAGILPIFKWYSDFAVQLLQLIDNKTLEEANHFWSGRIPPFESYCWYAEWFGLCCIQK